MPENHNNHHRFPNLLRQIPPRPANPAQATPRRTGPALSSAHPHSQCDAVSGAWAQAQAPRDTHPQATLPHAQLPSDATTDTTAPLALPPRPRQGYRLYISDAHEGAYRYIRNGNYNQRIDLRRFHPTAHTIQWGHARYNAPFRRWRYKHSSSHDPLGWEGGQLARAD